jgi:hypothetical protein
VTLRLNLSFAGARPTVKVIVCSFSNARSKNNDNGLEVAGQGASVSLRMK